MVAASAGHAAVARNEPSGYHQEPPGDRPQVATLDEAWLREMTSARVRALLREEQDRAALERALGLPAVVEDAGAKVFKMLWDDIERRIWARPV